MSATRALIPSDVGPAILTLNKHARTSAHLYYVPIVKTLTVVATFSIFRSGEAYADQQGPKPGHEARPEDPIINSSPIGFFIK